MEFATGAMGSLIPKLGELLLNEYNLKETVKKGIRDLKAELETMQAALEKVSNVPHDQVDSQVKIWANEVRELSFVIEDSLDSSMVQIEGLEQTKPLSFKGFIKKTRNKVTKFKIRHKIADDIKDVKTQVREVKERYERYKISDVVANLATTTVDPRLLAMYNKVSELVGIDKANDELIERLFEGDDLSRTKLKAVSVVGFGGLGKTTLAKEVYDKINKSFDCGGFVPMGRNPDRKKVLKDILLELDKQLYMDASTMDERQLINQLREFLADKRYLIVIDDIWDIPTWELIKCAMVDSCSGSRIIITTRICGVAEKVGGVYNMKPLSDENSKRLFFSRIFGGNPCINIDNQYDEVPSKILWRCGGVPLSIITIASLLAGKRREDWHEVYDSIGFGHEKNEVVENTRKILSFSYYDLPFCLKTCLLHLCIFPEDFSFGKESLIWKWVAEGLIPDIPGTGLFQLGESYLNELVNRNMIQLVEPCRIGDLSVCRLHDMVLDLIRTLSSQVNFITIYDKEQHITSSPTNSVRRLAIHGGSVKHNPGMEMQHVRSFNATGWQNSRMPSLLSFKVLRVLIMYKCSFSMGGSNLEHLRKLVQLRYLGLVCTHVVELPAEIGLDLKFLQTLDLRESGIEELPLSVGELSKLMCLRASEGTRMMFEIGKLISLEDLQLSSVDMSPNFFTQLANLTEMRVLDICFDEMDESRHKNMVESLRKLRRIQTLNISFAWKQIIHVDSWEQWMPPAALRELGLSGIVLRKRPLWLDSSCVPHLSSLSLEVEVVDEQDLQILGVLPSLRCFFLRVWNMEVFSHTVGSYEFQKLKDLDTNIEIITCGERVLPMLEQLECGATVGRQDEVGLVPENMPLLQHVTYRLDCQYCTPKRVVEAAAALRLTTKIHPNHPTLEIVRINYDDDDDE
ncbi:disease resistance protein RGA5-like [Triticum dicoccoides]|uniref:disease resistance protein RGA5-like n=1 Tax=Triticum dicoccoides TaxID=85692 RepID=UPI001890E9C5|nr:disease resistance protein RGA5-like [Triticum dicoccoides]